MTLFLLNRTRFVTKTCTQLIYRRSFNTSRAHFRNVEAPAPSARGPLEGIRILDLTRVLGKNTQLYSFELST